MHGAQQGSATAGCTWALRMYDAHACNARSAGHESRATTTHRRASYSDMALLLRLVPAISDIITVCTAPSVIPSGRVLHWSDPELMAADLPLTRGRRGRLSPHDTV